MSRLPGQSLCAVRERVSKTIFEMEFPKNGTRISPTGPTMVQVDVEDLRVLLNETTFLGIQQGESLQQAMDIGR